MRLKVFVLALITLISVSNAQNLTIGVLNYEGGAVSVQVFGANFSFNKTFENSSITIPLTQGNYHVVVTYKNLTLVKNVNVANDTALNLKFEETNDQSVLLYLNRHVIIGRGEVLEVDIILNPTDKFFRGDLKKTIPPEARNLTILEFTGELKDFSVLDSEITYESVIIPPNSSVRAVYHYLLNSNSLVINSEFDTKQIVLFLPPDVNAISDKLSYVGTQMLGSSTYNIYTASNISKGERIDVRFERVEIRKEEGRGINPYLIVGIVLILAGVGLYFYSKKKEGDKGEDWKI